MTSIGTPLSSTATKVLLCGSGELGKEVAIELQRLGVEVIALDRYENAPAMQVAHRSYVLSMLDGDALEEIIKKMLQTHVFIFPSYSEGLARSPIEALACGNYIILSKIFMKDYDIKNLAISFLDQKHPKLWIKKLYKIRNELNIS